jgi:hypothetical protein
VTEEDLEATAQQIADQGRDALIGRLRPAFEQAAQAHSDVLKLDEEQLEQMVQRAADRADGLQWRRALASVASEQLGIGLGEALAHPAVVRAQAIVGAPSYEEALAAVTAGEPVPSPPGERGPVEGSLGELEPPSAAEVLAEDHLDERRGGGPRSEPLRLSATHVGGIANLPSGASDLELRFSDAGLDIAREGKPLGRLTWREITSVDTPSMTGRRRRRQRVDGTIVVRSASGSASFEVSGMSAEELREQLAPVIKDRFR